MKAEINMENKWGGITSAKDGYGGENYGEVAGKGPRWRHGQ